MVKTLMVHPYPQLNIVQPSKATATHKLTYEEWVNTPEFQDKLASGEILELSKGQYVSKESFDEWVNSPDAPEDIKEEYENRGIESAIVKYNESVKEYEEFKG